MRIDNGVIICPLCNGEGNIEPILINKLKLKCYVCIECNSAWNKVEDISEKNFFELDSFMKEKGLRPIPAEVTILDYSEITKQLIELKLLPEESPPPT